MVPEDICPFGYTELCNVDKHVFASHSMTVNGLKCNMMYNQLLAKLWACL